jgi:Putative membrane protein insertion efficiency factor
VQAVARYGVVRGTVLAAWRLLRCNPFSMGGYDPVERQTLFGRRATATVGVLPPVSVTLQPAPCEQSGRAGCKEVGW